MERIGTVDGQFHEGNPSAGEKGTKVTAAWLTAIQEEVIALGGDVVTSAVEITLAETNGVLFANPADGTIVPYHLPVFSAVGSQKRYKGKNIGQGVARLDATDGKLIDGAAYIDLDPGDRFEVAQDGSNWQTF